MTMSIGEQTSVEKLAAGTSGFDRDLQGRTTLISGMADNWKAVFAVQFLAEGITKANENGVFVTFEETPADIRRNMLSLRWDIGKWEADGRWAFVDASPRPGEELVVTGDYELSPLLARIEHSIRKIDAKRVSVDSLDAIFARFDDDSIIRTELLRVVSGLRKMGVTAVITAERAHECGQVAGFGVEEIVADEAVTLRNTLDGKMRQPTGAEPSPVPSADRTVS